MLCGGKKCWWMNKICFFRSIHCLSLTDGVLRSFYIECIAIKKHFSFISGHTSSIKRFLPTNVQKKPIPTMWCIYVFFSFLLTVGGLYTHKLMILNDDSPMNIFFSLLRLSLASKKEVNIFFFMKYRIHVSACNGDDHAPVYRHRSQTVTGGPV